MTATLEKFKNNQLSESEEAQLIGAGLDALYEEQLEAELSTAGILRTKPQTKSFNLRPLFLVAASFCLLMAAYLYFKPVELSPQALALTHIEQSEGLYNFQTRAADKNWMTAVQKDFNNKNYAAAIIKIEVAEQSKLESSAQEKATFYKGLALMYQKKYAESAATFRKSQKIKGGTLTKDATWLLALCKLSEGNMESAKKELGKVAAMENWIKSKEASKILESME